MRNPTFQTNRFQNYIFLYIQQLRIQKILKGNAVA